MQIPVVWLDSNVLQCVTASRVDSPDTPFDEYFVGLSDLPSCDAIPYGPNLTQRLSKTGLGGLLLMKLFKPRSKQALLLIPFFL